VTDQVVRQQDEIESLRQQLADTKLVLGQAMTTVDDIQKSNVMLRDATKFWMQAEGNYRKYDDCVRQLTEAHARIDRFEAAPKGWLHKEVESLRQQLAASQDALENEQAKGVHLCHANCTMDGCINRKLRQQLADSQNQVTLLRDLIPKRIPDGFVSFGKYYAEQESIFNPSYKEMTKFKNKYLSDCEEALAIQPDDSALQAFAEKVREQCAHIIEAQDVDPSFKHRMADAIRSLKELPK